MIWRAKISLKIKIWLWLIEQNAILTKDNLTKRNWSGDSTCAFCNMNESIAHLFFECDIVKYTWSLVAFVIGADNRPSSFTQYWYWVAQYLKNTWVWLRFVGPSGKLEMISVSKKNNPISNGDRPANGLGWNGFYGVIFEMWCVWMG